MEQLPESSHNVYQKTTSEALIQVNKIYSSTINIDLVFSIFMVNEMALALRNVALTANQIFMILCLPIF